MNLFAFLFVRSVVARLLEVTISFLKHGGDSTNLFEARTCAGGDAQPAVTDQRERSLATTQSGRCTSVASSSLKEQCDWSFPMKGQSVNGVAGILTHSTRAARADI